MSPRTRFGSGAAALSAGLLLTGLAHGQAVERNLPPPLPEGTAPINEPDLVPADQDATPIAGPLQTIVLLAPGDAVLEQAPVVAVDGSRVARLAGVDVAKRLQRFLGKPISRQLIAEIEAELARLYRELGYPFVSISTPAQEITGGMLQLRVLEFKAGRIEVGADGSERNAGYIRRGVRLQPGEAIDSRRLSEDLDWLNRYPFHRVEAQFTPGAQTGETDLELKTNSRDRHWQVYGGYSNMGSEATGSDRYFVGTSVGSLLGAGSVLSYQLTGSSDFWNGAGGGTGDFDRSHPRYVSHGARFYLPTGTRQGLEATVSSVETNQAVEVFMIRQQIMEQSLAYRFALSNLSALRGDALIGVEAKQQARDIDFFGTSVLSDDANLYQLLAGWSYNWNDSFGRSSVELAAHYSPGNIDSRNNDISQLIYSQGRVADSEYNYFTFRYERFTPIASRFAWNASLLGQYTDDRLPLSVQMGVGGEGLVRGYTADDGSFDRGAVLRNQFHLPSLPGFGRGRFADGFAPYVFVDLGYGDDRALRRSRTLASAGIATDYQLGRNLFVTVDVARALKDADHTQEGDNTFEARVTFSY